MDITTETGLEKVLLTCLRRGAFVGLVWMSIDIALWQVIRYPIWLEGATGLLAICWMARASHDLRTAWGTKATFAGMFAAAWFACWIPLAVAAMLGLAVR